MILAGDIGGTKTILGVYKWINAAWICAKKQTFASADYAKFDYLLTDFIGDFDARALQGACLGVAGPVKNGRCQTTNLPWLLDEKNIAGQLGLENVSLVNDLEATAWGVLGLPEDQFVELNPQAKPDKQGHIAVIAAGTGLGEAIVYRDRSHQHVIAGEGGHADFGPNSDQELELLKYMRIKYPEHVSYERLVSGEGLFNIYQFLKQSGVTQETEAFNKRLQMCDPAAVIGEAGEGKENELSVQAVKLFASLYGAEASNLALKCLPYAGVYLAGGIASKLLSTLQQSFMPGFLAKGRYRSVLQKLPVKLCLNNECALAGALDYAKYKYQDKKR